MPQDVVVVFIHGINTTAQNYYEPLRDRILAGLPDDAKPHAIFRAVFWADIVRGRQQEYLNYAKLQAKFKANEFHRMVIEGLGDAAAYQKTEKRENSAYYEIQARIRKTIRDAALPGYDARPLVFIAHSLGCHIVSSYAWDLHKFKDPQAAVSREMDDGTRRFLTALDTKTSFERLDTFAGFVTMGCNMPLFTFTFGPQYVYPMTRAHRDEAHPAFPGPSLDTDTRTKAHWENYYSANDPLGYPLKPLNDAYEAEPLLSDHQVVTEGWWRATFMRKYAMLQAHQGYWTNPAVASGAARMIDGLIHAGRHPVVSGKPPTLFPTRPTSTTES
jgi:hypothetical protein